MPVKVDIVPPPPNNSKQLGVTSKTQLLYHGSKFRGFQKSKGNSYEVEVVLQIMKMSPCKVLFVVMLCSVLLCYHTSSAGPARQLASLAARASKIPRSIRAPFRNSEMMTARGFGKRRVPIGANVGGGSSGSGTAVVKHVADETPWGYEKREAGKLIEELVADGVDTMQMAGAGEQESFPLDWFASEMATNPALARTILQRFVDTNRDGILTTSELISTPAAASGSDSNDLF